MTEFCLSLTFSFAGFTYVYLEEVEEDFADSGEESDLENDDYEIYPVDRLQRSMEPPSGLPSTVEVLTTDDGCLVYLVGTAHFSESSQEDVAKVTLTLFLLNILFLFASRFYSVLSTKNPFYR